MPRRGVGQSRVGLGWDGSEAAAAQKQTKIDDETRFSQQGMPTSGFKGETAWKKKTHKYTDYSNSNMNKQEQQQQDRLSMRVCHIHVLS